MDKRWTITLLVFIPILKSCQFSSSPTTSPLFEKISSEQSGVDFSNLLFEDNRLNIITYEYFYNGAGVAIGDVNNDELPDIFFTANMVNSKLYLNKGDFVFEDISDQAGIQTRGKWATGASMVDINADGLLDIYISVSGPYPGEDRANICYINQGNLIFVDRAMEIGLADTGHTTHTAFFDYDKDGDLDAYLLTNTIGDIGPNIIRPKQLHGQSLNTDRLYQNHEGIFTDVSRQAGILKEGYGLGISVRDLNGDTWPDLYISNDYLSEDFLLINQQNGTFQDKAAEYFQHTSYSAMGNDAADINNDGWTDLISLDMLPPDNRRQKLMFGSTHYDRYQSERRSGYMPQLSRNTLQLHRGKKPNGDLLFSEIGQLAGIHQTDWSWSVLLADYDLDGKRDMSITNGYPRDITNRDFAKFKMQEYQSRGGRQGWEQNLIQAINEIEGAYLPNYLYQNRGNLQFQDMSQEWGFDEPSYSHGAAFGDLDLDGDLDLVIHNTADPVFIYKNTIREREARTYVRIKLKGSAQNPMGIGTSIHLIADSLHIVEEFSPYRGFQSSVDPIIHIGLGNRSLIDSLYIYWPDGKTQTLTDISTNQTLTLHYQQAKAFPIGTPSSSYAVRVNPCPSSQQPSFSDISQQLNINYLHLDPPYSDIKLSPLLPHIHSQQGPFLSVGDINQDQLDDLYISGAHDHLGTFFTQQADGTFISQPLEVADAEVEETDHILFDADLDGDLDLYICSGSSEFPANSPLFQDKLYRNLGQGQFFYDPEALPEMLSSTSTVAAGDMDGDGDMDLFVGGRIIPGQYPLPARSYVLENVEGYFKDVTDQWAPDLAHIGLVTDAVWSDYDGNGTQDLMLVGEWMPISVFKNEGNSLVSQLTESALGHTVGWWNTIEPGDWDLDGDIDYVVGNLGLNTPFKASEAEPVCIYVDDFDESGTVDAILCRYIQGENRPVGFRDDMINQMLSLRKQFPRYEDYAEVTLESLLTHEQIHQARIWKATYFQSTLIENKGDGSFATHPLPKEAQFAPTQSILPLDVNGDQQLDLIISGNSYESDVWTGPYDASSGLILMNQGSFSFESVPAAESGLFLEGANKELALVKTRKGQKLIFSSRNRGPLMVFEQADYPAEFTNRYVGNMRDYADVNQLTILANLESINSALIEEGMDQDKRRELLRKTAWSQYKKLIAREDKKAVENKKK